MTDPRATCRCGYPDTYNPCDKHRGKPSDPAAKALLNKIGESKIDLNDPRLAKQMTDEEIRNSDIRLSAKARGIAEMLYDYKNLQPLKRDEQVIGYYSEMIAAALESERKAGAAEAYEQAALLKLDKSYDEGYRRGLEEAAEIFKPGKYPDCPVQMTYQEAYEGIRAKAAGK